MKGYRRQHPFFSLCGLNCCLCPMNVGGYCPGCGGGKGHQPCAFIRCSKEHGEVEFCGLCKDFPCQLCQGMAEYDSFVPHANMIRDQERALSGGIGAYLARLEQKRSILDELLGHWNDGRKKSLYCLAVYLLEPEDLNQVLEQLHSCGLSEAPIEERGSAAAQALREMAGRRGIVLKLNKRPKEKGR